jgi:aryl-alcohol dehydrogenase-like predicted oxidoreductase
MDATRRGRTDVILHRRPYGSGGGTEINERVRELAADHGVSMAQIALAWLLGKRSVDAPIVGVTEVEHVEEAAEAVTLDLSQSDVEYLEAPYEPHPVKGHE